MRLTIVTINYNSSENTIKLLESLKDQTDKNFEVVVVDNNSHDVEKLMDYQTTETNIMYIKNDRTLGYSGGNNTGIRKALQNRADWVLLLNNDTWVESSFTGRLRAVLEGKEGVVGLALDEGERTAFGGLVQWLKPTLKHIYLQAGLNSRQTYAIGGAMLIHKNVFDRIGLLDENYFLYFEDVDFCQRARKAGIPLSFISEIKISHSVSASTKKLGSAMLLRYHYRNALYFNFKNGPFYIKLLVWLWSWFIAGKQVLKIAMGKNRGESKAILVGIIDFYRKKTDIIKAPLLRGKTG